MLIKHSISNNELRTFHTLFCSILKNNMLLRHFSHVQLFVTLWTVALQVPLSMGFSRQEYWSGLTFPSPEDLPDPRIKPMSLASPALTVRFFTTNATWETHLYTYMLRANLHCCRAETNKTWKQLSSTQKSIEVNQAGKIQDQD